MPVEETTKKRAVKVKLADGQATEALSPNGRKNGTAKSQPGVPAPVSAGSNPTPVGPIRYGVSRLTDSDLHLFNEGSHFRLYEKLGAHLMTVDGQKGTHFAVWAPNANSVAVIGSFNNWDSTAHYLSPRNSSGIWEGFIPGVGQGDLYKYFIRSNVNAFTFEKTDPFSFYAEVPHRTASIVWDLDYEWQDEAFMQGRHKHNSIHGPISVYEIHVGSWRRVPEEDNRPLTYREMAPQLASYVKEMGFTHVQFMPIMEHPFDGSWGYQIVGFFAPTSRFGTPQDFMYLVDYLHREGIGVLLDWVPSHFPTDGHGLAHFDGTCLYEHADPKKGFHPDWGSLIFNYGRNEVRSFLISSALFWMDRYHTDGFRVDAVASMLYLDYSREEGEWIPNQYGGRENIEAIWFLRRLNEEVYKNYPDSLTIAEESTSWGMVSRPTYLGGLGFGLKWDMGWMHDTLTYITKEPIHRKYHHQDLTFRMLYAYHENFILPLSHDEVSHGKGSLLGKMPGDLWQKFANLRALFAYMFTALGKKHLFMGGEFGQWNEWNCRSSLDWHLLQYDTHQGLKRFLSDVNHLYVNEPALHEMDFEVGGFEWIDCNNAEDSILIFARRAKTNGNIILTALNFTPVPRYHYSVGVPRGGYWKELVNSDAREYGGSGIGNAGGTWASDFPAHGRSQSINITLPPLSGVILKSDG